MTFALAFPDIYEIGMSHLGLKVLYSIANDMPFVSAERVFSPWLDLGEAMKEKGILLSSLESGRPLKDFDIAGFSLQYELSYTTVLNMLDLGGVPLRSEDRMDASYPLIIAGGPCTVNPRPMSPFIDAFLIGDGEEAVREILDIYHQWKASTPGDKHALLRLLADIKGVYVPLINSDSEVTRRVIPSLDEAPFPDAPIVPYTHIIHDRINIEVARGCSQGCRFCQAGMICRPVRERSPENALALAERSLQNTGYDCISFTSLSAGDYSCLFELLQRFNMKFYEKRISMSLPSLRVASVDTHILRELRMVKKSGFTIAPEAGTERLRAVINKDFTEDMYFRSLEALFTEGWQNLKLYFMTGLPTETEQDIAAIIDMAGETVKFSRRLTGRKANISVGISSFVPKPHTPFQWCGQNDIALLKEKNSFIRNSLRKKGIKYKGHKEEMSLLEAAFARGDESLSALIEKAWSLGCRLDAWTEAFDFGKWQAAMDISGIDASAFACREYAETAPLPWDNIKTGITKKFLLSEYRKAFEGSRTKDCRQQCHKCGLKCKPEDIRQDKERGTRTKTLTLTVNPSYAKSGGFRVNPVRVRVQYAKTGLVRYLSHLEMTTAIVRAMRRAGFPFNYSGGFHPAPRISFGPALRVGVAGLRELFDVELIPPFDRESALIKLNRTLPEGLHAGSMEFLKGREKSLDSFIIRYVYEIKHNLKPDIKGFTAKKEVPVRRNNNIINIRDMVEKAVEINHNTVHLTLRDAGEIKVRLDEVIAGIFAVPPEQLDITRLSMYGWDGAWVELLEGQEQWAVKS